MLASVRRAVRLRHHSSARPPSGNRRAGAGSGTGVNSAGAQMPMALQLLATIWPASLMPTASISTSLPRPAVTVFKSTRPAPASTNACEKPYSTKLE
jgi:hypothetical protein